ncbi:hypothetical protein ACSBR2_026620 [Camellia fascicularis]
MNSSRKCFEKVLSNKDVTDTLEIPMTATDLPKRRNGIMVVWDQTGRQWEFQMRISVDFKRMLEPKRWIAFANFHELEEGETVNFFYSPTDNSYSVEFEGPNRLRTLQLFPTN